MVVSNLELGSDFESRSRSNLEFLIRVEVRSRSHVRVGSQFVT